MKEVLNNEIRRVLLLIFLSIKWLVFWGGVLWVLGKILYIDLLEKEVLSTFIRESRRMLHIQLKFYGGFQGKISYISLLNEIDYFSFIVRMKSILIVLIKV